MKIDDYNEQIGQARRELGAWMQHIAPDAAVCDFVMTEVFCTLAYHQFRLHLGVHWNPTAEAFEAHWVSISDPNEGMDRPFCAATIEDVRVLACASLLRLLNAVREESTMDDAP